MITVLIVEDEEAARKGLVETIDWKEIGCIVIAEAENGTAGMELIRELKPDLVIADVVMPFVDGISMITRLKEEGVDSNFILLSGHNDFGYLQRALRSGALDYLMKPLKVTELKKAIERIFYRTAACDNKDAVNSRIQFHPKEDIENRYVRNAVSYIKHHYDEELSISVVAEHLKISEGYLSRLFKKETYYTFTNYVNYYRIVTACKLLCDYRLKVYEVVERVGFSDSAYFSTLFKKMTGFTPSEYQDMRGKMQ